MTACCYGDKALLYLCSCLQILFIFYKLPLRNHNLKDLHLYVCEATLFDWRRWVWRHHSWNLRWKISNRVNSRGNPRQKLIFFPPPAVVCLLFLTAGIIGTESGSGGAARSSRSETLDEELQATGCTPPTSQPGDQILPLFPAARRTGRSAAENLIRYAESERNVKRFHVKTQPFLLTVSGQSAREHGSLHPYYAVSLCYVILSDSRVWRGGLQTTMAGYWAVVVLVTSLLRLLYQSADVSQYGCAHGLAIVVLFVCAHDSVIGCLVCSSAAFVCVLVPMVSHYVAG